MTELELAKIALRYIEKSYSYEELMWGDDLYNATEIENALCGELYEECQEIGTKAFREKIKILTETQCNLT